MDINIDFATIQKMKLGILNNHSASRIQSQLNPANNVYLMHLLLQKITAILKALFPSGIKM